MIDTTTTFPLNSTTSIPAVGYGTYVISNEDVETAVSAAIKAGYRHIDTAPGYRNETTVGAGTKTGLQTARIGREDSSRPPSFGPVIRHGAMLPRLARRQ